MKMLFIMNVSVLLLLILPSIISEVTDFSTPMCSQFFNHGKPPEIPGILENSCSKNNRYKTICQKYDANYRFATLFDTTNKIPVFSAYRFTANRIVERPDSEWMNEPQLEVSSNDELRFLYENQATDEDYIDNIYNVNRGHLFPVCHSGDEVIARSTFTMTNAVPQKINFNGGSWNRLEISAIAEMSNYCRDKNNQNNVLAHVLTGAVPGKITLNNRVNIPSHMWMTFCCYNSASSSWSSKAYWALNKDENINSNATISEIGLEKLQGFLSKEWKKITHLFEDCK